MIYFAIDLLAVMFALLTMPALFAAGAFFRHGDRNAFRRLRFIVPVESILGCLLLLWAFTLKINNPSGLLLASSLSLGLVGGLISLLLHTLNKPH